MKNADPLEKDIEEKVVLHAKKFGMLVYKFTSPSRRSVPDRMLVTKGGIVWFIEFKRVGQKPTPAQFVEIEKLRSQKVVVFVIDNIGEGKNVVEAMAHGPFELDSY